MSHVNLIASDKKLPLLDHPRKMRFEGSRCTYTNGIRVLDHGYYRPAVDALGFDMKPFRCELDMCSCEDDLRSLSDYLKTNLSPGEELELWSLWVGTGGGERPRRYRCTLSEFGMKALDLLTEPQYDPDYGGEFPGGLISQICLTITC